VPSIAWTIGGSSRSAQRVLLRRQVWRRARQAAALVA
jgi:hypothetical protein